MLSIAHLSVYGAIGCTLYFNAMYAITLAPAGKNQVAMVALALTIDLAKATFLPAAALAYQQGRQAALAVLLPLWILAFAYSSYAGYGYLMTTRMAATSSDLIAADQRSRLEADYARANTDLATAKSVPDWQASAACTRPATPSQRTFCTNVAAATQRLETAATLLANRPPLQSQPELVLLANLSGLSVATITLLVVLFPALLVELVAAFGLFVLRQPPRSSSPNAPAVGLTDIAPSPPPPAHATALNLPAKITWKPLR